LFDGHRYDSAQEGNGEENVWGATDTNRIAVRITLYNKTNQMY
jgi:hypothetical protein